MLTAHPFYQPLGGIENQNASPLVYKAWSGESRDYVYAPHFHWLFLGLCVVNLRRLLKSVMLFTKNFMSCKLAVY